MTNPALHPDIPAAEATSVTHFLCPDGPTTAGEPAATHHLVPRSGGQKNGQPAREEACTYCGKTAALLRQELPLVR